MLLHMSARYGFPIRYHWRCFMPVRRANAGDIDQMLDLYAAAREFMRDTGNATQWPDGYPGIQEINNDLRKKSLYVFEDECSAQIDAVFFFAAGPDHTYNHIDGAWPNNEPYSVMHRVASRRGSGAGRACLAWACAHANNLRIDTHEKNGPMRHVLRTMGFMECGTIICEDGTPRVAYQHVRTPE